MCLGVFRYPNGLAHVYRSFLDLYINQSSFNALGPALPSYYNGSIDNHTLSVPVSTNLSLFSLPSLVIFLFHSLRQLPSPTCPQAAVITLSSPMRSCQSPCYFFPSPICHSRLSCLLLSPLIRSGLHLTDCTLFLFFLFVVKDLDTEKYVHLVSTLEKLLN